MSDKQRYCAGCRNNFYNGRVNFDGGNTCWSLETATVVKRLFIHRDAAPPYLGVKPEKTLDCWYGDTGMRAVNPDHISKTGYWK